MKASFIWDYFIGFEVSITMATRTPIEKVEIVHEGQSNQLQLMFSLNSQVLLIYGLSQYIRSNSHLILVPGKKKITQWQIFCHSRDGINKVSRSPKACIYTSKSHMLYWDSLQETPFCHWGRIRRQRYLFSEESWLTGGIESHTWKISDAIPFYAWLFPRNRDRV